MENIVSVKNFKMCFGQKTIIKDLSFEVGPGDVFAFLGSNGSGKTTTIRSLLGIYQPTSGELLIKGKRYVPDFASFLGYLPEERGLYKKEKVIDIMVYFGQLKGMSYKQAKSWSLDFLKRVGLEDYARVSITKLSGGQQQKVQLGSTIMNNPELLILDEPTKGFDPVNRRLMTSIVEEMVAKGTTVILVTHQMEEVERMCNRLLLLKDGYSKLYGSVDDIRSQFGNRSISIRYEGVLPRNDSLYRVSSATGRNAVLLPQKDTRVNKIFSFLGRSNDLAVNRFSVKEASLDDIFVRIYSDNK